MILADKTIGWFKLNDKDPFTAELHSAKDVTTPRSVALVEIKIWKAIDRQQMAAVVGDVGSGKTTIVAKILEEMERNKLFRIIRVYPLGHRKLTPTQLLEAVLLDLTGDVIYAGMQTRARLVREALDDVEARGQKILMVIDEAHELPTQTLKDLKKLHEVQGKFTSPLSICLVGQPRLLRRLQREVTLKEVLERTEIIEVRGFRAKDGGMDEALEYLEFKLRRTGSGRKANDIFTPDGLEMLLSHPAARYPLGVNNLVSLAMNFAVEIGEKKINDDVMAHAFTQISSDGQFADDDEELAAGKVA